MSKFQHPAQKNEALFDDKVGPPRVVRFVGVDAQSPEAERVLYEHAGAIRSFISKAAQNYSLGSAPIGHQRQEISDDVSVRYLNRAGEEIVQIEVTPPPPPPPAVQAVPGLEEYDHDPMCMIVLYSGYRLAAIPMEYIGKGKYPAIYKRSFKNSYWDGGFKSSQFRFSEYYGGAHLAPLKISPTRIYSHETYGLIQPDRFTTWVETPCKPHLFPLMAGDDLTLHLPSATFAVTEFGFVQEKDLSKKFTGDGVSEEEADRNRGNSEWEYFYNDEIQEPETRVTPTMEFSNTYYQISYDDTICPFAIGTDGKYYFYPNIWLGYMYSDFQARSVKPCGFVEEVEEMFAEEVKVDGPNTPGATITHVATSYQVYNGSWRLENQRAYSLHTVDSPSYFEPQDMNIHQRLPFPKYSREWGIERMVDKMDIQWVDANGAIQLWFGDGGQQNSDMLDTMEITVGDLNFNSQYDGAEDDYQASGDYRMLFVPFPPCEDGGVFIAGKDVQSDQWELNTPYGSFKADSEEDLAKGRMHVSNGEHFFQIFSAGGEERLYLDGSEETVLALTLGVSVSDIDTILLDVPLSQVRWIT